MPLLSLGLWLWGIRLHTCSDMGLLVNHDEASLVPTEVTNGTGMTWDSQDASVSLSTNYQVCIRWKLMLVLSKKISRRMWQSLLEFLDFVADTVPIGHLLHCHSTLEGCLSNPRELGSSCSVSRASLIIDMPVAQTRKAVSTGTPDLARPKEFSTVPGSRRSGKHGQLLTNCSTSVLDSCWYHFFSLAVSIHLEHKQVLLDGQPSSSALHKSPRVILIHGDVLAHRKPVSFGWTLSTLYHGTVFSGGPKCVGGWTVHAESATTQVVRVSGCFAGFGESLQLPSDWCFCFFRQLQTFPVFIQDGTDSNRESRWLFGSMEQVELPIPVPLPSMKILLKVCMRLHSFKSWDMLVASLWKAHFSCHQLLRWGPTPVLLSPLAIKGVVTVSQHCHHSFTGGFSLYSSL